MKIVIQDQKLSSYDKASSCIIYQGFTDCEKFQWKLQSGFKEYILWHTSNFHSPKPGVLNYFFLRATKGRRQFKDRYLRVKWSPLSYVFLCILELTKGQTSMVCKPDLAQGPPFEKACPKPTIQIQKCLCMVSVISFLKFKTIFVLVPPCITIL